MSKGTILYCVCLTCGARNSAENNSDFCPKGHDDWLEARNFVAPEMSFVIDRAMEVFGLDKMELLQEFKKGKSLIINQSLPEGS